MEGVKQTNGNTATTDTGGAAATATAPAPAAPKKKKEVKSNATSGAANSDVMSSADRQQKIAKRLGTANRTKQVEQKIETVKEKRELVGVTNAQGLAGLVQEANKRMQELLSKDGGFNTNMTGLTADMKKNVRQLSESLTYKPSKFKRGLAKVVGVVPFKGDAWAEGLAPKSQEEVLRGAFKIAYTQFTNECDAYDRLVSTRTDLVFSMLDMYDRRVEFAHNLNVVAAEILEFENAKKECSDALAALGEEGKETNEAAQLIKQLAKIDAAMSDSARSLRFFKFAIKSTDETLEKDTEFAKTLDNFLKDTEELLNTAQHQISSMEREIATVGAAADLAVASDNLRKATQECNDFINRTIAAVAGAQANASVELEKLKEHLSTSNKKVTDGLKVINQLADAKNQVMIAEALELAKNPSDLVQTPNYTLPDRESLKGNGKEFEYTKKMNDRMDKIIPGK